MEINKEYAKTKKQSIKNKIDKHIDEFLDVIEKAGNLDYFTIEIKSHEGRVDIECNLKSREKVYWCNNDYYV